MLNLQNMLAGKARSAEPRDRSRINTLDYLLMTVGSLLGVYSAGMAINMPDISFFYIRIVVLGAVFSFFMRRILADSPFLKADGVLYFVVALLTIFRLPALNGLLPGEGFPREVFAAGWLAWMLSLGSFLTWRDGTLLFQAVPAIAVFGLVGCYDTFREVTFCFFVFLLCLATLFARAHGRDMLRLVIDSGYAGRAEQRSRVQSEVRQDQALYERMRLGPWRWLAGPEWALASALLVVGLSLLGAPVVKTSVEAVAGGVRVQVNQSVPTAVQRQDQIQAPDNLRVGNGPNRSLTDRPLWEYESEGGNGYLRTQIYDDFTGAGWRRGIESTFSDAREWIAEPKDYRFTIRRLTPLNTLPTPAEVTVWENPQEVRRVGDGAYMAESRRNRTEFSGISIEPADRTMYAKSLASEFVGTTLLTRPTITARTKDFIAKATKGAKTDKEKADALARAIGDQVRYNINAIAVPPGENAVDFFLFESKEGYCDLFATTMTVAAREAGLPARYVQGFLPEPNNRDGAGRQLILEKDYHAWCEIFFEDVGWVVYDATGYAESVPGGERGRATSTVPFWETLGARRVVDTIVIGLVVLAFGVAIYLRIRPNGANGRRREIDRVAVEFVKALEKVSRKRRRLSQTLGEYVDSLGDTITSGSEARSLAEQISRRMYGPGSESEEDVRTLRKALAELKTGLKRAPSR